MKYIEHKDLRRSVRALHKRGGPYQKAADAVMTVIGRITSEDPDPFKGFTLTKRGEKRVSKCRKYDLAQFCRLITVVDDGFCHIVYAGSHDDCDAWLDRNRGFVPVVDANGKLIGAAKSDDNLDPETRVRGASDQSYGKLYEKLPEDDFEFLVESLPRALVRRIEALESINDEEDIVKIAEEMEESDRRVAIHDIFVLLRQGNHKAARTRIALFRGDVAPPEPEMEVKDGEDLRTIPTDSPQYAKLFEHFVRTADYRDWMVFMHPEQERVAEAEFSGPAKLTGVSGSGKTCIVVRRAVVLAERYPTGDILVLTLNRPLAALIDDLISTCASPTARGRIKVLAFFDLCQEFLFQFEPKNRKLYDDRTWKSEEHIDEVWREYYRCELNNRDAACMQPVHDSLISRSIDSERYIREEFDWIRSAMSYSNRRRYFDMERLGRSYPLDKRFRRLLIDGLQWWEDKMRDIGITDYLGIATALYRHRNKLREKYRCVLIDECQDFGTIELEIIAAIVENGSDNLFFCGDTAQHVSWKHQSLKDAGVPVPGARSKTIRQNYRNSRDVLQAAYKVLVENLTEEMIEKEDFEILDPEYANFSGSTPLCLEALSLAEEIAYAVAYAKLEVMENINRKACIAICGCSLYEIQEFGKQIDIPVLEGTRSIDDGSLFLSDLEQTKGFEFDLVCIVNASDGMIPNPATPEREQFRDLSKLYVAMTRAKLQLVLSYSGTPSAYLSKAEDRLLIGKWTEFVSKEDASLLGEPPSLDDLRMPAEGKATNVDSPIGSMTGEQFLYTPNALGLSSRLIEKIRELVKGQKIRRGDMPVMWENIAQAARDTRAHPSSRQQFGPEAIKEFDELVKKLGLRAIP